MRRAIFLFFIFFLLIDLMVDNAIAKDVDPAVKEAQQAAQAAKEQRESLETPQNETAVTTEKQPEAPVVENEKPEKKPSLWSRYWAFAGKEGTIVLSSVILLLAFCVWAILYSGKGKKGKDLRHTSLFLVIGALFFSVVAVPVFAKDKLSGEELTTIAKSNTQGLKENTTSIDKLSTDINTILVWMGKKKDTDGNYKESYSYAYLIEKEAVDSAKSFTDQRIGPLKSKLSEIEKNLKSIQDDQATLFVNEKLNEKALLMAAGKTSEEISAFFLLDRVKDIEKRQKVLNDAWKKLAEKPTVNWSSPEAQTAIKSWVEVNMLGGRPLEQVMGKDAVGKTNTDAVALLDASYAGKQDLVKTNLELTGIQTKVSELSTSVINNTMDIGQLCQILVWKDITGEDGKTYRVPISLQPDMLPENVQVAITDVSDLKAGMVQKADKTEVEALKGEIQRVEAKVDILRDAITAVGLGEEDRGLVYVYVSYDQEKNINGFKSFLKVQGQEKNFEKIRKAAIKAAEAGIFKLVSTPTQQKKTR
ncbi:MAG: hypothetical protein PHW31_04440 [Candidatus Pacebacteria bacterium]|nr:hypothetical protein [Candidatus Paceibacterota bacterium]